MTAALLACRSAMRLCRAGSALSASAYAASASPYFLFSSASSPALRLSSTSLATCGRHGARVRCRRRSFGTSALQSARHATTAAVTRTTRAQGCLRGRERPLHRARPARGVRRGAHGTKRRRGGCRRSSAARPPPGHTSVSSSASIALPRARGLRPIVPRDCRACGRQSPPQSVRASYTPPRHRIRTHPRRFWRVCNARSALRGLRTGAVRPTMQHVSAPNATLNGRLCCKSAKFSLSRERRRAWAPSTPAALLPRALDAYG